jgi:hypothetical protein
MAGDTAGEAARLQIDVWRRQLAAVAFDRLAIGMSAGVMKYRRRGAAYHHGGTALRAVVVA